MKEDKSVNIQKTTSEGSRLQGTVVGFVIGAIFTLAINITAVRIKEDVQKQRTLEAIQLEIVMNKVQAESLIDANDRRLIDQGMPNILESQIRFSNIFLRNYDAFRYVTQLDADTQSRLITYFTRTIDGANKFLDTRDDIFRLPLSECYSIKNEVERSVCVELFSEAMVGDMEAAEIVKRESENLLKIFHPIASRQKNVLYKLLLGN